MTGWGNPPEEPTEPVYPRWTQERPAEPAAPAPLGEGYFFMVLHHPDKEGDKIPFPYRWSVMGTHVSDVCISAEVVPREVLDEHGELTIPALRVVWFRPTP